MQKNMSKFSSQTLWRLWRKQIPQIQSKQITKQTNNTNNNSQGESQNPELLQYITKMPSFSKKV